MAKRGSLKSVREELDDLEYKKTLELWGEVERILDEGGLSKKREQGLAEGFCNGVRNRLLDKFRRRDV